MDLRKKSLYAFISVVILFVLLELILQSLALIAYHQNPDFHPQKFNIIVLGESTSSQELFRLFKARSWPDLLEEMFQKNNYNVNVINLSEPATHIAEQIEKFDQVSSKGKPDLVLGMLGINNYLNSSRYISLTSSPKQQAIKTIKLLKWIGESIQVKAFDLFHPKDFFIKQKELFFEMEDDEKFINQFSEIYQNSWNANFLYRRFENGVRDEIALREKRFSLPGKRNYYIRLDLLADKLITIKPTHAVMLHRLNISFWNKDYSECYQRGRKILDQGLEIVGPSRSFFNTCKVEVNLKLQSKEKFLTIIEALNDFNTETKKDQIPFIYVNYPTWDVNTFKNRNEEVLFDQISNLKNFQKALSQNEYNELFLDRFAGTFGHTKTSGSRIIAENVYNYIVKNFSDQIKLK